MKNLFLIILLTTVSVTRIFAQNNAPVAVPDSIDVLEQVPVLIDAKANDYDPDGDQIFLGMVDPSFGVAYAMDEMIYFKSTTIDHDRIKYTIRDDQNPPLYSSLATIWVNVLFNPDIPVAVADTFELMQLLPHNLNILANDYDLNGDVMKIREIKSLSKCSVQISPDSLSVTFTSELSSLSTFKYSVQESNTATNYRSRTVEVRVLNSPNPDLPVAMPDTAYTNGGIGITIPVMDNDKDPQGDLIEIKSFSQPKHGTVEKIGDSLRYLPELSYAGEDFFTYDLREKLETGIYSANTTVRIYVSKNPNCPVGVPDMASGTTALPLTIDVLPNDYDVNGDVLAIKDVSGGIITADNKILYQSSPLTLGQDSITYRVMEADNNSSYSEWTKVNIQLAVNPDLPVAVPDYVTTRAGIPIAIRPLLNDIQNAADSLIIPFASVNYSSIHQGVAYSSNDTVIYIPAFQAEGTEVVNYFIRGSESNTTLAKGNIYVNIVKQPYYDSLVINNINAGVNANGSLFSKQLRIPGQNTMSGITNLAGDMTSHYRYPYNAETHTIFASSLWISGLDEDGAIHLCAERYNQEGYDAQAGPISNTYDTTHYLKYGRLWKVSKAEIDYHRQNYWNQGYVPVEAISSWPGNGNPALGEAAHLAPYSDQNNDGFYNCMDGDFPLIRGDETIFFMYNDDIQHTENDALPLEVEVHAMVYGFNAPADTALYNTVFVHYDIINRSTNTYYNCTFSAFTDTDLGFPTDDFTGCDVIRGTYYTYNGKEIDGNGQYFAYGENPPAQAVTILAGPYMDADGMDNPAGGCEESVNGQNFGNAIPDDERFGMTIFGYFRELPINPFPIYTPPTALEMYLFMNGKWRDSSSFTYGGNAHPLYGSIGPDCRFMYPGDSDPLNWGTSCNYPEGGYNQGTRFWTEEEAGNKSGDRRGVGSMGPFTFHPGQMQEIDIAYVTGQGNAGVASSLRQMFRNIDSLRYAVALGQLIVPSNELGIKPGDAKGSVIIFPNPASGLITIKGLPAFTSAEYAIYNLQGLRVAEGKLLQDSRPEIGVSHLARGMYVVRLTTGKAVFTGKFIRK